MIKFIKVFTLLILFLNLRLIADEFRSWGGNEFGQHGNRTINSSLFPTLSDSNDS